MRKFIAYIFVIFFTTSFSSPKEKTLDNLLNNPFDLQKFKKVKGGSNSGHAWKKQYYFKPNTVGVYYAFFLFPNLCGYIGEIPNRDTCMMDGLRVITYKPAGKYKEDYLDPTETLIEVIARFNDNDLPELAFVGLDTVKIKNKLGNDFLRKDDFFIYYKNKRALTLKIKGNKVEWLKYTRLKIALTADNIPSGLLKLN